MHGYNHSNVIKSNGKIANVLI